MPSVNKVILVGNLTVDPEMRYTPNGSAVTTFSLAVNESYKNAAGEKVERVEFFNCEAWNNPAEIINQYAQKGQPLYVEGKLRTDTWDDKTTGEKKYRTKVEVREFQLLASKPRDEQAQYQPAPQQRQDRGTRQQSTRNGKRDVVDDENLPF